MYWDTSVLCRFNVAFFPLASALIVCVLIFKFPTPEVHRLGQEGGWTRLYRSGCRWSDGKVNRATGFSRFPLGFLPWYVRLVACSNGQSGGFGVRKFLPLPQSIHPWVGWESPLPFVVSGTPSTCEALSFTDIANESMMCHGGKWLSV